ncbi:CBS domain-containing protein [Aquirhabdus parva]|uniref:CBS domain-containing protein n=1 Tax=Aquirhabdus parva TaxID=2283318 RepID=A0A345P2V2_9GAMM|nr:CBS domain-containing protein [Aquirhabdus parva]AXI01611.1 CBS domain-containing protein [Aquirhabdus parva]
MKTVAHILNDKPNQAIYTITPKATVLEAITLMAEKGIGALIVAEGDKVVGIVSERDYARKVALMERSSYATTVSEIMSADVITVTPKHTNEQCMILMTENRLRHLPVLENDKLLGLISIGDLVKGVIEDQKNLIEQLQRYIRGE